MCHGPYRGIGDIATLFLAGFADVEVKGNFSDEPLNAEHTDMIFVATKPAD